MSATAGLRQRASGAAASSEGRRGLVWWRQRGVEPSDGSEAKLRSEALTRSVRPQLRSAGCNHSAGLGLFDERQRLLLHAARLPLRAHGHALLILDVQCLVDMQRPYRFDGAESTVKMTFPMWFYFSSIACASDAAGNQYVACTRGLKRPDAKSGQTRSSSARAIRVLSCPERARKVEPFHVKRFSMNGPKSG